MKIAVISKKGIADSPLKKWLLDGFKESGDFDIQELDSSKELAADFDKVLVFGGDGTMLDAARHALVFDIPVLGVNLGYLGFLTEFDKDATSSELAVALKSDKHIDKAVLSVENASKEYLAINELVVKSTGARPIVIDLYVDGNFADTYKSDGLIVSTPTGSTAYSLSAGGPIVAPDVKAIIINPICPHSLHSRPIVVSDKANIEVRIAGDEGEASLTLDGNLVGCAKVGESIKIKTSNKTAKFVKTSSENFFNKLLKKMNVWSTTLQKTE
ncbi:MAG: NAD(+)/NADH kinase [Clostridia bacterium]|nr:NAD(+)/NADH kinase [Clostridia bacterium]